MLASSFAGNDTNSAIVERGIQSFSDNMTQKIVDELAVVHIIGAFSAGKSRLVRELLRQHQTALALLPISSQERQTALPLEITYGEVASLQQIDNEKPENTVTLTCFPTREQQMRFDAETHQLRLEIPEPKLLLGNISLCSAEEGIKRLVLKDMPGWNSGDSFVAENPLANGLVGADNISLVYVVRANAVDSQDDLSRLQAIFSAVENGDAFFYNGFHLIVVVTRCDATSEYEPIKQRVSEHLQQLAEEIGIEDEFILTVLCVEFGKEQQALNHEVFTEAFWQAIFVPIAEQKQATMAFDWANRIQHWPQNWFIQAKLTKSLALVKHAVTFIDQFNKGGEFIANMNNTRLLGLSENERRQKVHNAWLKQVGQWHPLSEAIDELGLDAEHPLAVWWDQYWLAQLRNNLRAIDLLSEKMVQAISKLPTNVSDLQDYFFAQVNADYQQANALSNTHFYCLCQAIEPLTHEANHDAKVIATLLSVSMLDAKYADYYHFLKTNP